MLEDRTAPERVADYLTVNIDSPRLAETIAAQMAKIDGKSVSSKVGVVRLIGKYGGADDFPRSIQGIGCVRNPSGRVRTQVDHRPNVPKEWIATRVPELDALIRYQITRARVRTCAGATDNLAAVVHLFDEANDPPQAAEVLHFPVVPEERVQRREPG